MTNSWKRPKIKIAKTKSEWVWDVLGYSFYIGSILFLIIVWQSLPAEVPAHYNASGEVNRWGSKWELWILPGVGAFIIFMMQIFEKFPETHNYPERLNETNAEQFYLHSRKMMNQLKNICLIIFSLILLESISVANGWSNGLGGWFLPMIIIGTGIPMVLGVIRQRRIK